MVQGGGMFYVEQKVGQALTVVLMYCHTKTGPDWGSIFGRKIWTGSPIFSAKNGPTLPEVDLGGGPFLAREKS